MCGHKLHFDYKNKRFVDSEEETNNKLVDVLNTSKVNEIWSILLRNGRANGPYCDLEIPFQ